jgi:hypothetical protein
MYIYSSKLHKHLTEANLYYFYKLDGILITLSLKNKLYFLIGIIKYYTDKQYDITYIMPNAKYSTLNILWCSIKPLKINY